MTDIFFVYKIPLKVQKQHAYYKWEHESRSWLIWCWLFWLGLKLLIISFSDFLQVMNRHGWGVKPCQKGDSWCAAWGAGHQQNRVLERVHQQGEDFGSTPHHHAVHMGSTSRGSPPPDLPNYTNSQLSLGLCLTPLTKHHLPSASWVTKYHFLSPAPHCYQHAFEMQCEDKLKRFLNLKDNFDLKYKLHSLKTAHLVLLTSRVERLFKCVVNMYSTKRTV